MTYPWHYVFDPARRTWAAATAATTIPEFAVVGSRIAVQVRGRDSPPDRRTVAAVLAWARGRRGRRGRRATVLLQPQPAGALAWTYRRLPAGTFGITTFGPVDPELPLLGAEVPVRTAQGDTDSRAIVRVLDRAHHADGVRIIAAVRPDPALGRRRRRRAAAAARIAFRDDPRPTPDAAAAQADWRYCRLPAAEGPVWGAQATGPFRRDARRTLPGRRISVLTAAYNVHRRTISEVVEVQPLPGRARVTVRLAPGDS